MSSHHFVKEQQEPALLILDAQGFKFGSIGPLLEWVPTVLVAQEQVFSAISWGIKIDLILADLNFQRDNFRLLEEQYPVKFIGVKDGAYLEETLQYLVATKHGAVNILGYPHQRLFELESKLDFIDLVIWDLPMRYFPVKNGIFKKWYTATTLQIHAPEGTFVEITNDGQSHIYQITHATLVEIQEGISEFKSDQMFWIGERIVEV